MGKRLDDEQVITALMAAPTITAAADLLGVTRQTVYNCMNREGFDEKLACAKEEEARRLANLRETATVAAIDSLVSIVKDEGSLWSEVTTQDKIEAAKTLLYGN